MSGSDGLWQKAFQLAHFIVRDRASAYRITASAIEKLGAQSSREKKRSYWRFRKTQLRIRRISRTDEDTLQWLVYLESENYEKEQERNDQQTELDMVIRYVKHLVFMTTAASSFYVNVGLNRLLRNYSTPEAQQCYELVTEHYPASEEYRKVKGRLMNRLAERFRGFIKVCTSQYRELRFETYGDQERWITLVDECLEAFTPWSSRNACVDASVRAGFGEPGARGYRPLRYQPDEIETHRCHWFMHSPCYEELAKRLGLDPPQQRLAVPRFLHNDQNGRHVDLTLAGRRTTPLTQREIENLEERRIVGQAVPREAPLQPLKIVAHGVVYAQFDPTQEEKLEFAIPEGTKLLEVRTDAAGTDLIVATHWIDYTEWNGIMAGEYTIALRDRRELLLKLIPAVPGSDPDGGATVLLESRSSSRPAAWWQAAGVHVAGWQNLPRFALASALLVALGWFGAAVHYRNRLLHEQSGLQTTPARGPQNSAGLSQRELPKLTPGIPTYLVSSEDRVLRGPGNADEIVVTFAPGDSLVLLDLVVGQDQRASYRATLSPFMEEQELLTENLLKPKKRGSEWVVEFALPSSLVAGNTHYLITLAALDNQGKTTPVARFMFKVRK